LEGVVQKGDTTVAMTFTCDLILELLGHYSGRHSQGRQLNTSFFTSIFGRFPAVGWAALPRVLALLPLGKTLFLRLEVLTIAQEVLRYASQVVHFLWQEWCGHVMTSHFTEDLDLICCEPWILWYRRMLVWRWLRMQV
jgi:hypothetical protein